MPLPASIPLFGLFGEPAAPLDERFVHIETLDRRSRPNDWNIRPHAHRDLNQLFVILRGSGCMRAGEKSHSFEGPALLVVPVAEVHAFEFTSDSKGYVITFIDRVLRRLGANDAGLTAFFSCAGAYSLSIEPTRLRTAARLIEEELGVLNGINPVAVEALLAFALTTAHRLANVAPDASRSDRSRRAALIDRYRALIEQEFRSGWSIAQFASELGVSVGQLRQACHDIAGRPPIRLLHERLVTEAKRKLLYTSLQISEVAYDLGFEDPAYFNRFFLKHVGSSPARYRNNTS